MPATLPTASGGPLMPVSVKAVVLRHGAVLLGENERDEWELLGGRPEAGEPFEAALVREVQEEAGASVAVGPRVADEPFEVLAGRFVRVVAFRCELLGRGGLRPSSEHRAVRLVPLDELAGIRLPPVYRRAIGAARDLRG